MEKKIEWTTGAGNKVVVTVALVLKDTINLDGDVSEVSCCKQRVSVTMDGKPTSGVYFNTINIPQNYRDMGVVATWGNIAVKTDNYARIQVAITEIEATPEWQAKVALIAKNEAEVRDYDKHYAKMQKIMNGSY